jgi:hypothetical protein
MTPFDQEYEEIIEEYEEEVFVPQEFLEPPMIDTAVDTTPSQGKPRCIILIFDNHNISICCTFMLQELFRNHMHIYIYIYL